MRILKNKWLSRYRCLPAVLLLCGAAFAQADNTELAQMYREDQAARMAVPIDWNTLNWQDSIRRNRVNDLIKEGKLLTGKDYYHSAMIFQHGNDTIASAMAVSHIKKAITLDSTVNKWLLAAAIDRDFMRRNQPQVYGTQFIKMGDNAPWERYKIDTTKVTDAERQYYHVETLAQQRQKERNMNLQAINDFARDKPMAAVITFIRQEKQKGYQSLYNISEEAVNSFGYALLQAGKKEDALKIFKLNTELYPQGFNTFDSYGECLLLLGNKKAALQAYKKSLDLNPQNENARQILANNK